jgi:GntR family transcriptional regulator, transcriptional repressor for pyruvate dehydrogenase complex
MAVTDGAIEAIKAMISSGQLRPGSKLPRETDLAVQLEVSRNTLREAVKALSLLGVLTVRQGDGTYVTSLDPARLVDAMAFLVDVHRDETVLQILEVRRVLEPAATALAAQRLDDDEIADLADLLGSLSPAPSVDELVANDLEFHRRIAVGSGNAFLATLLESLSGPTQRVRVWRCLADDDALGRTMAEHWAIQRALAARDVEAARSWATVHVCGVEAFLRPLVEDDGPLGANTPEE